MNNYLRYQELLRKIADVQYASALLNWDQETYMPPKGAEFRAQQLSTLAGIAHELSTTEELGDLLEQLKSDDSLTEKKNEIVRNHLKNIMITKNILLNLFSY